MVAGMEPGSQVAGHEVHKAYSSPYRDSPKAEANGLPPKP